MVFCSSLCARLQLYAIIIKFNIEIFVRHEYRETFRLSPPHPRLIRPIPFIFVQIPFRFSPVRIFLRSQLSANSTSLDTCRYGLRCGCSASRQTRNRTNACTHFSSIDVITSVFLSRRNFSHPHSMRYSGWARAEQWTSHFAFLGTLIRHCFRPCIMANFSIVKSTYCAPAWMQRHSQLTLAIYQFALSILTIVANIQPFFVHSQLNCSENPAHCNVHAP